MQATQRLTLKGKIEALRREIFALDQSKQSQISIRRSDECCKEISKLKSRAVKDCLKTRK